MVTAQTEQVLRSYQMEFDQNYGYEGNRAFLWAGNAFIAFLLVALLFFSILFTNETIFADYHRYLYLLTIFLITQLCIFIMGNPNFNRLYLMPFSLMALFMLSFFRKKVVLPVYLVSLFPMLILPMGVRLFFVWTAAGVLNIFTFGKCSINHIVKTVAFIKPWTFTISRTCIVASFCKRFFCHWNFHYTKFFIIRNHVD